MGAPAPAQGFRALSIYLINCCIAAALLVSQFTQ
jgi:hypothetical protein